MSSHSRLQHGRGRDTWAPCKIVSDVRHPVKGRSLFPDEWRGTRAARAIVRKAPHTSMRLRKSECRGPSPNSYQERTFGHVSQDTAGIVANAWLKEGLSLPPRGAKGSRKTRAGARGQDFPAKVLAPLQSLNLVSERLKERAQFEEKTPPGSDPSRAKVLSNCIAGDEPNNTKVGFQRHGEYQVNRPIEFPVSWPRRIRPLNTMRTLGQSSPESPNQPTQLAESAVTNLFTFKRRTLTARQQRRGFSGVLPLTERQRGDEGNASALNQSRFHNSIMTAMVGHND